MPGTQEIKIVAKVEFNSRVAYVLNRAPVFRYQYLGEHIVYAQDGPFFRSFVYRRETSKGRFKAFGGRVFNLNMMDGSLLFCDGSWWDGGDGEVSRALGLNLVPSVVGSVEGLKKCYVFMGCSADEVALEKLADECGGPVYTYRDYEKIIRYDDTVKSWAKKAWNLSKQNESLIKEARRRHGQVLELRMEIEGLSKSVERWKSLADHLTDKGKATLVVKKEVWKCGACGRFISEGEYRHRYNKGIEGCCNCSYD